MAFEVYDFKMGERVMLVVPYSDFLPGDEGTVTYPACNAANPEGIVEVLMDVQGKRGRSIACYNRRIARVEPKITASASSELVAKRPLPDAIYLVAQSADRIFPRRSYDTILKSLMEEMGELSTEIAIAQGTKKRAPSPDGVKGEAVDVFVVAVDMLRAAWGDELFTSAFTDKVASKLAKWEGK